MFLCPLAARRTKDHLPRPEGSDPLEITLPVRGPLEKDRTPPGLYGELVDIDWSCSVSPSVMLKPPPESILPLLSEHGKVS